MEIDKRDFIAMNNNSSKVAIERNSSFLMNCYAKICKDENQSTKEEFIKYYKEAIDKAYKLALMIQNGDGINTYK